MIHVLLLPIVPYREVAVNMKFELFGKELIIKDCACSLNGKPGKSIEEPYINMYVTLTNSCNAKCPFCCNAANASKKVDFDFYKFYYLVHEVSRQIKINKLSFTGGEPSLDLELLTRCVKAVKETDVEIFTIINTNGINLTKMEDVSKYFDSIALSRHHFSDEINNQIFGTDTVAQSSDIQSVGFRDIIHFSCNLQKGYIDSSRKVMLYLEEAAKLGVGDIGFVSLMPVNKYCKDKFVDFTDIQFESLDNLFISKEWNNKTFCRCRNYLYLPKEDSDVDVVKLYTRYYVDPSYSTSTLVFDGQYLRKGFNGEIII